MRAHTQRRSPRVPRTSRTANCYRVRCTVHRWRKFRWLFRPLVFICSPVVSQHRETYLLVDARLKRNRHGLFGDVTVGHAFLIPRKKTTNTELHISHLLAMLMILG